MTENKEDIEARNKEDIEARNKEDIEARNKEDIEERVKILEDMEFEQFNNLSELLKFAEESRHYIKLLYELTSVVAETDSIGECYCEGYKDYTKNIFQKELDECHGLKCLSDNNYIAEAGAYLFDIVIDHQRKNHMYSNDINRRYRLSRWR